MGDVLNIDEVEARATALVLALSGDAYAQGPIAAAWSETRSLSVEIEADAVKHLRFHASVARADTTEGHRGAPYGSEQVESALIVTFAFRLRPGEHPGDLRSASRAAQDVARAINRSELEDWSPRFRSISKLVNTDRGIAMVSVAFAVIHIIEV